MGILRDPVLFSQHFRIQENDLHSFGALDPILNGDTRLFVDPVLLSTSSNKFIISSGQGEFKKRFGDVIRVLKNSKEEGDLLWRWCYAAGPFSIDASLYAQ